MNPEQPARIERSKHSTDQVDEFLDRVQGNIDDASGAGSPAIKPETAPHADDKPATEKPAN
jgi:hypothetical protein